ncbi:MAG: LTA synthase family protein [Anaerovoracaceae bacterium]
MIIFVLTVVLEIILRAWTFGAALGGFSGKGFLIAVLMSAFFACILEIITRLLGRRHPKAARVTVVAVIIFWTLIYSAQLVYYDIFRTFFSIYSMSNGGQVLEFIDVIIVTIIDKIIPLLMNFAAAGLAVFLTIRKKNTWESTGETHGASPRCLMVSVALMCFCLISSALLTETGDRGMGTPYEYLHRTNEIKGCVKNFGLVTASALDLKRLVFGFNDVPRQEAIAEMNEYFGENDSGTDTQTHETNEMTGIFEGKNLIYITAESFTDLAIDEKHTPTLYKMSKEGLSFTNFYTPVWGVSTLDGEYVNCTGLIPKAGVWSMTEASDNYLPFTLGHQFGELGYVTKAYHNHRIDYYHRDKSHPNLGYDFDGQGGSYDFGDSWPESDLEMINKTTPDFLTPDDNGEIAPFHVYYLTVSGHLEYNFKIQDMAAKHEKETEDLNLSQGPRAYVAANMELDLAMELLLKRLEEAEVLDNTVIVLAGDHYPYALSNKEISELRGHKISEPYEKFRSTAIVWTPGMEPMTIEKTASNLDLLPTVSNLFGLDYDSRLLMGTDIFSDRPGLVVFEDKDWISDRGTRQELVSSEAESDIKYVEETDSHVADMFKYSAWILNYDYYASLKSS